MSRAVQCPSCGAQHEVTNPGITALSCEFCKTLVYWDEQAVRDAGVKSILDPPSSALRVGNTATLNGSDVTVLGRVRYSYGSGLWDEWFVEDAAQNIIWLTEDEKEFVLEKPITSDVSIPAFEQLRPGMPLNLHKREFFVEEVGRATCLGVEGQVPFVVVPNERYPFADLASSDGKLSVGIEYDEAGTPSVYQGQFVPRDALLVEGISAFSEPIAGTREIRCPSCGSPQMGGHPPDTEMLVCPQCGAGLDLSDVEAKVVSQNQDAPSFSLEIGDHGKFDAADYEVVGRMHYVESEWGGEYHSFEYLLYHEGKGYLWLVEENNHWMLNQRSHKHPNIDVFRMLSARDKVVVGDTTYRFVEAGRTSLRYVDGALPWVAQVGETYGYADMVAPPQVFSAELSVSEDGGEVEYFEGRYVPVAEMRVAFKKKFNSPSGVGMAQPFERSAGQKAMMFIGAIFTLVNLGLCGYSATQSGRVVYKTTLTSDQYRSEWLSEPFVLKRKPSVVELSATSGVDNAWVALDIGLVNSNEEVCLEASGDISYYHGYEGGESWSEGSKSWSQLFVVDKPGTYRLLAYGAAGSGEQAVASGGAAVSLSLREGAMPSRYFLIMFLLSLIYPIKEVVRQGSMEKRRFPADDDDDD